MSATRRCKGPCGLNLPPTEFYAGRATCRDCYNRKTTVARGGTPKNDALAEAMRRARIELATMRDVPGPSFLERHSADKWPSVAAFDAADQEHEDNVVRDARAEAEMERARVREAKALRAAEARVARRASDFTALKADDYEDEFDTSVANRGPADGQAAQEKRQEFNEAMARFGTDLRDAAARSTGEIGSQIPAEHADYIRDLAEQERRFGNRRWARSIAIAEAHEQLSREQFMHVAERYFRDKVTPTGYAALPRDPAKTARRTVSLLLSDLHLGSELDAFDEPVPFQAVQEARRLEYLMRQLCDYKPQYRSQSEAMIILNGDIIEGQLMHDFRSGSPLTEQKSVFWSMMRQFVGYVAQQYPSVRVVCQPGNHGRDKVRHPGRATSRKWDGHETECYLALRLMCSELKNVTWQIDFRAVSIVDLHGSKLGVTHGDTEVKLGHPDNAAKSNAREFDRINSTRLWGVEFDAWVIGHFHTPRYSPGNPRVIYNAAMVPPNGYARASGYVGEPCGAFLFESVEGHAIGDLRFLEVDESTDADERLGKLITPFRFVDRS